MIVFMRQRDKLPLPAQAHPWKVSVDMIIY